MKLSALDLQRSNHEPYYSLLEAMCKEENLTATEVSKSYFTEKELSIGYNTAGTYSHSASSGKSRIYLLKDHPDYKDHRMTILLHEYGHYVARTKLYKKIPVVGNRVYHIFRNRPFGSYWWNWGFKANCCVLIEEMLAWMIAFYYLMILNLLEWNHFTYGWDCFKTYLPRLASDAFFFKEEVKDELPLL